MTELETIIVRAIEAGKLLQTKLDAANEQCRRLLKMNSDLLSDKLTLVAKVRQLEEKAKENG